MVPCRVEAYPPPSFYWSRVNGTMPSGFKAEYDGNLTLTNVREADTGYYKCFTNNTNGSDVGQVHLVIKGLCIFCDISKGIIT